MKRGEGEQLQRSKPWAVPFLVFDAYLALNVDIVSALRIRHVAKKFDLYNRNVDSHNAKDSSALLPLKCTDRIRK